MDVKTNKEPTVFNLGISGDTTKYLLRRLEPETTARKFPGEEFTFIVSIGTNNAFVKSNGEESSTTEAYRNDLEKIIETVKKYSSKLLFVGLPPCEEDKTTPVFWADIYYTNERILMFDKVAREVCAGHQIPYVSTFEFMRDEMERGRELFVDGLHPNDAGHELIFNLVRTALDSVLGQGQEEGE